MRFNFLKLLDRILLYLFWRRYVITWFTGFWWRHDYVIAT